MNPRKTHVKRGDYVQVLSGDHKGKSGVILQVNPAKQQVIVEGVRMIKKTVRKSQEHPEGAILEREGPIHISNVKATSEAREKAKPKAAQKTETTGAPKAAKKTAAAGETETETPKKATRSKKKAE